MEQANVCKIKMVGYRRGMVQQTMTVHVACEVVQKIVPARTAVENFILGMVPSRVIRGRMMYQWVANRNRGCPNGTTLTTRSTKDLRSRAKVILHILSNQEYELLTREKFSLCRNVLADWTGHGAVLLRCAHGRDEKFVYIEGEADDDRHIRALYQTMIRELGAAKI